MYVLYCGSCPLFAYDLSYLIIVSIKALYPFKSTIFIDINTFRPMDLPTLINGKSPFPILVLLGGIFHFIPNYNNIL